MIPIHLLNLAWQSLLLSACAWLLVTLLVRDARRRAWACALGLWVAVIAPFFILAWPAPRAESLMYLSPEPASEWKPNWTVKVQPIPARPVKVQRVVAQANAWSWRDLVLPAERVWMSGVLLFGVVICGRTLRAWWWRRRLQPGPRHQVACFEGKGTPCVVGLLHPMIAVPKEQTFSEEQWRWLLAHEGEHLRGGDALLAWSFEWVRSWLWWNPFIHALIGGWAQAREEVCDAVAVKEAAEGEKYADFLLEVASAHQTSGALAMASSRPARRLKARLLAVLEGRRVRERVGLGFMTVASCSIAGAVVIVSCSGVRADDPVQPKTTRRFVIPVEPGEFAARVKEVQAQGYMLMDGSSTEVALLKDKQGVITELRKVAGAKTIVTRVYRVAPDLLSKAGMGKTAKQVLEARGISFPEGCSAVFNPVTSQLIVKNTVAALQRVEEIVNEMQVMLPQVYLQTKIIDGPELIGESGRIYDEAAYEALYRSASQKTGFDLMSAPSVTTKLGQRASIEVVRDVFGLPPSPIKLVGVRVEVDPQSGGDGKLKLVGKLEVGRDTAPKKKDTRAFVPSEVSSYENVKQWDKPFDVELKHGQTAVLHLGETLTGRFVSLLITAKAIRPDGTDADRFGANLVSPVQGVQVSDDKLPSEADAKTAQRAAEAADAQRAKRQVYVSAKVVNLNPGETLNGVMKSVFNTPGLQVVKEETKSADAIKEVPMVESAGVGALPNGVLTLSGVLTDPQFQIVLRALAQKKGTELLVLPSATAKSGQTATLTAGTQSCVVEPTLGADGYTIDLSISYSDSANGAGEQVKKVTTAVTIWDGQTVVLGGTVGAGDKGQPGRGRLIFVTGQMIDPSGGPVEKTK